MLIQISPCRVLYRVVPVSCAKEHGDEMAGITRCGDADIVASRQNRKSRCLPRSLAWHRW
jgi:hypothetical protein